MKVRIDGEQREIDIDLEKLTSVREMLRIIEYRFLYPDRVIKHIELNGRRIPPEEVSSVKFLKKANIVTEPSINLVKKHIDLSIVALEAVPATVDRIVGSFPRDFEATMRYFESIIDSVDWTVRLFERYSHMMPFIDGSDESVLLIEETLIKAEEIIANADEGGIVEFFRSDFLEGVLAWRDFLARVSYILGSASMEIH